MQTEFLGHTPGCRHSSISTNQNIFDNSGRKECHVINLFIFLICIFTAHTHWYHIHKQLRMGNLLYQDTRSHFLFCAIQFARVIHFVHPVTTSDHTTCIWIVCLHITSWAYQHIPLFQLCSLYHICIANRLCHRSKVVPGIYHSRV